MSILRTVGVHLRAPSAFLLLAGSACHTDPIDTADTGECTELTNAENYAWTGSLNIPQYVTAEHADVHIDFTGLDHDLLCHDLDPVAGVESVGLTRFPLLSMEEIAEGLTDNSLKQVNTNGFVSCLPQDSRTDCYLSEFNFAGTSYDTVGVYGHEGGSFLLSFSGSTDPSGDAVWLGFLVPTPDSDVTEVQVLPTCDVVDYEVTLDGDRPAGMDAFGATIETTPLAKSGPWCIDWTGLTVTGNLEPLQPGKLDEVLIGHYTQSPSEIAAQFLDIEELATELYTLELTGGTHADLASAVSADGAAFPGFTDDGTWVLGLRCTSCTNPVPMFLTVVDPR